MRYYSIVLKNATTGQVITPSGSAVSAQATYTSFVNGKTLPNALDVVMDVPVASFATPGGQGDVGASVQIWGVGLREISQSNDLNGALIEIYGGMQKGLPLANPKQAGLLVRGYVQQAFGNAIGIDRTLDLVVQAGPGPNGTGTLTTPKNMVLNWQKGQNLSTAIKNSLNTAFPGLKTDINISFNLIRENVEVGFYPTLAEFAALIKNLSRDTVNNDKYNGVEIVLAQDTFRVYDGTSQQSPKPIQFQDMIGQPTWIGPISVQLKTVMRSDINVGDFISMPPVPSITTSQSQSQFRNSSIFKGSFYVTALRHVGHFRQPSADSWVTVMDVSQVPQ